MARATFHRGGLLAISAAVLIVTFAGGYALGHGTQPSSGTPSGCNWSDFPAYPNSFAVSSKVVGVAYRTYASVSQVARFYQAGAGQRTWSFIPNPHTGPAASFRFTASDSCHGILAVQADPAGTIIEANPDPGS